MKLICPECGSDFEYAESRCGNGHQFDRHDGVVALVSEKFRSELEVVEKNIQRFRGDQQQRIMNADVYAGLPQSMASTGDAEWRIRQLDLKIILRFLEGKEALRILDLGAWNGWLSHRLVAAGHDVTAVDYFSDEYDGLRAMKHYPVSWRAIQMDLANLETLAEKFDFVIINHGLAFFQRPADHIRSAMGKLRPGGTLMAIGLKFYRNPSAREAHVISMCDEYRARYGTDLFFRPTRALLDWNDRAEFQAMGLGIKSYRELWWWNLKATVQSTRPEYVYAAFQSPADDRFTTR